MPHNSFRTSMKARIEDTYVNISLNVGVPLRSALEAAAVTVGVEETDARPSAPPAAVV